MTSHYLDLSVLPDAEISTAHLLGALYDRLHRHLAQQQVDTIGVSFPQHRATPRRMGAVMRLHGTEGELRNLMADNWLKAVRDHIQSSDIAAVPHDVKHRTVQRRQFKTNAERLRRRRMMRKGETAEQAAQAIPITVERTPDLPYVHVRSLSTGQPYCLFIQHGPLVPTPVNGRFNTYGLSHHATIPWF